MFSATTEWGGRILAEKVFREQNLEKVKVFVCGWEGRLRSAAEFLSQAAGCEIWTGLLCADSTQPLGPACVPGSRTHRECALTWVILLWLARNMDRFCDSWIDWGSAIFLRNWAALKHGCRREEGSSATA